MPAAPVKLDDHTFVSTLRNAPRGSSGALSGMRFEYLKLALDNATALSNLTCVAQCFARAQVPPTIADAMRLGALTALQKPDGGIRGIVAGEVFRRVVSKSLAAQFAEEFQTACLPHQLGMSTRAGTDCVGHLLRAMPRCWR